MSIQSSKSSFIERRKLSLEAGNQVKSANIYGRVFACTEASGPFSMNFNDGEFFEVRKGVEWALIGEDRFARLQFKAAAATDIEFYAGNFFWHENVVVPIIKVAKTRAVPHTTSTIGAATSVVFNVTPAGLLYRKSIVITNNDPAVDLEVEARDITVPATWRRAGVVFAKQAWYLETSDEIRVTNLSGAAINYGVVEIFYLP